jgi:DNA-binding NarL/FixJ family response regulator
MVSSDKVKVLLTGSHVLVLEGLHRILKDDENLEVVGVAKNLDEALQRAHILQPDVVVLDIDTQGTEGIWATREFKAKIPEAKILVMSIGENLVDEAIEAGASGYMTKSSEIHEFTAAIHQVFKGLCPIAPSITKGILKELVKLKRSMNDLVLTDREKCVLRLIADGKNTNEIKESLFISISTVKRIVGIIFDKLGVDDRPQAVNEAVKRGLI